MLRCRWLRETVPDLQEMRSVDCHLESPWPLERLEFVLVNPCHLVALGIHPCLNTPVCYCVSLVLGACKGGQIRSDVLLLRFGVDWRFRHQGLGRFFLQFWMDAIWERIRALHPDIHHFYLRYSATVREEDTRLQKFFANNCFRGRFQANHFENGHALEFFRYLHREK